MKKSRKKLFNKNQKSFYFEEYLQTNEPFKKQKKTVMSEDRIYILFSFYFLDINFSQYPLPIFLTKI